ncbi:unnamed protein product [Trichobilharzia szidati]|nr:unnamed protein product [Trichobilharzia szidati]
MVHMELIRKFPLLMALRRISTYENRLHRTTPLIPVISRCASVFSSFRSKFGQQSEKEKEKPDDREWVDAVQEIEKSEVLKLKRSDVSMSRTELREWKKRAFLHILEVFIHRSGPTRKGFSAFIQQALAKMPEYEVADDLECYKAVIRIFPTGRMTVTRYLQAEFGHYPRQQQRMIDVLNQMTDHHVLPDDEVGQMIIDVFGWRNHAMQRYRRIMYWMPKLYHSNPWAVQFRIIDDLDQNPIKLGYLIAERICPDRMTEFTVVRMPAASSSYSSTPTTEEPDSIISAQSPEQRALLAYCTKQKSNDCKPTIYLDGPHYVWYRNLQAAYYTLWTEISADRLKREADAVKINQVSKFSATEPWNLKFLKYSKSNHNIVLNDTDTNGTSQSLLPHISLLPIANPVGTEVRVSNSDVSTKYIAMSEPEYDNRWLTIRQSHTYKYLPGNLCQHEQGEGTILAVGIVVPTPDALDNQKKLYDWEVSNKIDHIESKDSINRQRHHERSALPPVPKPAPSALLRLWLNELHSKNPCFDEATLVIRVPTIIDKQSNFNVDDDISNHDDVHSVDKENDSMMHKSYN